MNTNLNYPRDMVGYGARPPAVKLPGDAKVALSLVINYEEGGESSILHGDDAAEHLLSEIVGATPYLGMRHLNMESLYEYGSRAGFWRLLRLFTERSLTATVFAVGMALERNPDAAQAMLNAKWDVASHGYRWLDYQQVPPDVESEHISRTIKVHEKLLGVRPFGFYQGKPSPNTLRLVAEEGGFKWSSDCYNDDLPYWNTTYSKPILMLPYTLTLNDMRFVTPGGFSNPDDFFNTLRTSLDFLLAEAEVAAPKMMSVGLHCRLAGQPARAAALARFLDYVVAHKSQIWVAQRTEIADYWKEHYPCPR